MPGHKGKAFLGPERWDITEIEGADVLYSANGIIKKSQQNAASLFGTEKTLYSTEGSSLCIRAMVSLIKMYAGIQKQKPTVLAGRNAHKSFVTACAVLDVEADWLFPPESEALLSCNITAEYLESVLSSCSVKPTAVYVTSPDYLGNMLDIKALSQVCRKHKVLLAVDNAHGAYLKFLPVSLHPMDLGADICCDSAHKTLPVLTGGAYLHISKLAPEFLKLCSETAMSLFASTSPSYLILQSLDMANEYLSLNYKASLSEFISEVRGLKNELVTQGYRLLGNEPLKLTLATKEYGYTGLELAEALAEKGIICEFSDPDFICFMLTPENGAENLEKLKTALLEIPKNEPLTALPPKPTLKKRVLSLNEAVFSPGRQIPVSQSLGKILASPTVSCPPAVPLVMCGEEIDQAAIEGFSYYGIKECTVVF